MGPTIYLGFINGYSPSWSSELARGVEKALRYRTEPVEVHLDLHVYYAPERRQYHATLIIARLLRELPDTRSKIVGITSLDLFVPVLTFVFGQSQLNGPGAVVSTHRLHNEFYGLPADDHLLLTRTVKEVVHELGHAFGLVHCPDYRCVMKASTYVEDVDLKEPIFCSSCRIELEEKSREPLADTPRIPRKA